MHQQIRDAIRKENNDRSGRLVMTSPGQERTDRAYSYSRGTFMLAAFSCDFITTRSVYESIGGVNHGLCVHRLSRRPNTLSPYSTAEVVHLADYQSVGITYGKHHNTAFFNVVKCARKTYLKSRVANVSPKLRKHH